MKLFIFVLVFLFCCDFSYGAVFDPYTRRYNIRNASFDALFTPSPVASTAIQALVLASTKIDNDRCKSIHQFAIRPTLDQLVSFQYELIDLCPQLYETIRTKNITTWGPIDEFLQIWYMRFVDALWKRISLKMASGRCALYDDFITAAEDDLDIALFEYLENNYNPSLCEINNETMREWNLFFQKTQVFNRLSNRSSYEFPRQQKEINALTPEVMQFKASQKLFNPKGKLTSPVWYVFQKILDGKKVKCMVDMSVDGKMVKCGKEYGYSKNSTGPMRTHIEKKHPELFQRFWPTVNAPKETSKKITSFLSAESVQQLKVDKHIVSLIARKNLPFNIVEDQLFRELLITKFGENYIRKEKYYRTSGLDSVYDSWKNVIATEVKNKEVALSSDLWSNPSVGVSLMVITCSYFSEKWERKNRILIAKAVKGKHSAILITKLFDESLKIMRIQKESVVFLSRDDGSNIKLAANLLELESTQCVAHCIHIIITESLASVGIISELVKNVKCLSSSFSRSSAKKEKLEEAQKALNLPIIKIPKIINVRWNSVFNAFNAVLKNEAALLSLARNGEEIFLKASDFSLINEIIKFLQKFAARSTFLCRESSTISEAIPNLKLLHIWVKQIKTEVGVQKIIVHQFADSLLKSIETRSQKYHTPFIYTSMAVDPRFAGDLTFLTAAQWKLAESHVVRYILSKTCENEEENEEENDDEEDGDENYEEIVEDEIDKNQSAEFNDIEMEHQIVEQVDSNDDDFWNITPAASTKAPESDTAIKQLVEDEFKILHTMVDRKCDPFVFYESATNLPYLSQAAKHFLLATATSVDGERFFNDATSLYQNKDRNRVKGEVAAKLLFVKVTDRKEKKELLFNDEIDDEYEQVEIEEEEADEVEPFSAEDFQMFE